MRAMGTRSAAASATRASTSVNGGMSRTAIATKKNDPPHSTERRTSRSQSVVRTWRPRRHERTHRLISARGLAVAPIPVRGSTGSDPSPPRSPRRSRAGSEGSDPTPGVRAHEQDVGDPGHEADADGNIRPAHDLAIAVDPERLDDQPKSGRQPLRMRDLQQGALLGHITHDARDGRPPARGIVACTHVCRRPNWRRSVPLMSLTLTSSTLPNGADARVQSLTAVSIRPRQLSAISSYRPIPF